MEYQVTISTTNAPSGIGFNELILVRENMKEDIDNTLFANKWMQEKIRLPITIHKNDIGIFLQVIMKIEAYSAEAIITTFKDEGYKVSI